MLERDLGDGVRGSGSNHPNSGGKSADAASFCGLEKEPDRFVFSDRFSKPKGRTEPYPFR
jgi:hypothetical protein